MIIEQKFVLIDVVLFLNSHLACHKTVKQNKTCKGEECNRKLVDDSFFRHDELQGLNSY